MAAADRPPAAIVGAAPEDVEVAAAEVAEPLGATVGDGVTETAVEDGTVELLLA
jgi:hypothetical protein